MAYLDSSYLSMLQMVKAAGFNEIVSLVEVAKLPLCTFKNGTVFSL